MKIISALQTVFIATTASTVTVVATTGANRPQESKSRIELLDSKGRARIILDANAPMGPSIDILDRESHTQVRLYAKDGGSKGCGLTVFDLKQNPRLMLSTSPEPDSALFLVLDTAQTPRVMVGGNADTYAGISINDSKGRLAVEAFTDTETRGDVSLVNSEGAPTSALSKVR
jgi:hypothetical protein